MLIKKGVLHRYDIDIDNVTATMNRFNDTFYNFTQIQINDKIYFDNSNTIHINKQDIMGSVYRWIYSINRDNTINKLKQSIDELLQFKTMINMYFNTTYTHANVLMLIINQINDLLTNITKSIDILIQTYSNDKQIIDNLKQIRIMIVNIS